MPPIPGTGEENKEDQNEIKTKTVGLIIPPAEIRKFADKTAEFVAKNGSSFEELVMKSEANNPRFSFLKPNDPYRAYYEHKVIEFSRALVEPKQPEIAPLEPVNEVNEAMVPDNNNGQNSMISSDAAESISIANIAMVQKRDVKKELKKDLKPPSPDQYTIETPTVAQIDMDIIRLTAQFVAKNGQKFLTALTEREKQNPQFDFLKPTHQLFALFTSYVDAYVKCLAPRKEDIVRLQTNITDKMSILNRCGERFEYENMQMQAKKKKEEIDEEERRQMAEIDWNDFVIVETIDLFENEDLPAPANFGIPPPVGPGAQPSSMPQNNNIPAPAHANENYDGDQYDMDEEPKNVEENEQALANEARRALVASKEGKNAPTAPAQPTRTVQPSPAQIPEIPTIESDVRIKKNYVRKPAGGEMTTVKCQICGQMIPIEDINEHVRIELLDPKYREIQKEIQARTQSQTSASGEDIADHLRQFARKRPDLFGGVDDQLITGEDKSGAGGSQSKIVWDGQSASITRTTANVAMLAQQQRKNLEETMKSLQEKDGGATKVVPASASKSSGPTPPNSGPVTATLATPGPKPSAGSITSAPPIQAAAAITTPSSMTVAAMGLPRGISVSATSLPDSAKKVTEGDVQLYQEDVWVQMHPGPYTINVRVPELGTEENWNLKGQLIQLQLEPLCTIQGLKDNLSTMLGGMPSAKMKLKTPIHNVLKDTASLAYYNFMNGSLIELSAKERGGRGRNKQSALSFFGSRIH
eukprot:TRINITY_DN12269_c0_g1_i15.p1 TRINITY_DN12269_c0_g1~~TRINITY_DN12269_c0_g1_i15.p1  ORF type:complete len:755 (+),score=132.50 TRINITY_DN12269_c0_g1_i15:33-2297(+)